MYAHINHDIPKVDWFRMILLVLRTRFNGKNGPNRPKPDGRVHISRGIPRHFPGNSRKMWMEVQYTPENPPGDIPSGQPNSPGNSLGILAGPSAFPGKLPGEFPAKWITGGISLVIHREMTSGVTPVKFPAKFGWGREDPQRISRLSPRLDSQIPREMSEIPRRIWMPSKIS